jgi:hypothetical protein
MKGDWRLKVALWRGHEYCCQECARKFIRRQAIERLLDLDAQFRAP